MFTHVVLFKLKDGDRANAEAVRARLMSMQGQVAPLRQIEVGINVIPSERAYDLALITRFDSRADYDAYQVDPFHQDVLAYMKTVLAGSVAVDFGDAG